MKAECLNYKQALKLIYLSELQYCMNDDIGDYSREDLIHILDDQLHDSDIDEFLNNGE